MSAAWMTSQNRDASYNNSQNVRFDDTVSSKVDCSLLSFSKKHQTQSPKTSCLVRRLSSPLSSPVQWSLPRFTWQQKYQKASVKSRCRQTLQSNLSLDAVSAFPQCQQLSEANYQNNAESLFQCYSLKWVKNTNASQHGPDKRYPPPRRP